MKRHLHTHILLLLAVFLLAGCGQVSPTLVFSLSTPAEEKPATYADTTQSPAAKPTVVTVPQPITAPVDSDSVHEICRGVASVDRAVRIAGDGVSLLIDSGAVGSPVEVTVSRVAAGRSGALSAALQNVTDGGGVVRLLPDGQRFEKAVTLAIRYDSAALPSGYTPSDIQPYTYDVKSRQWVRVPRDSVDTAHRIVYARTTHFSDYIAAVLREPESGEAVQFTPTLLSDLPEAEPLDGLTLVAPPDAVSSGAATLEYPIALPAGRRGMAPHLVVRYNSGGGSGTMGQGWSLPVSEISIDTRWGVPRYDAQYESEDYLLDGDPIVTAHTDSQGLLRLDDPVHRRPYAARTTGDVRYWMRVEGSFRRIVRHGTGPADYWWEVTDKDGTRHFYGQDPRARLSDRFGRTARWMLDRSEDAYGNTVVYHYSTKYSGSSHSEGAGRQVVLKEIRYTDNTRIGTGGRYRVKFTYADKPDAGVSFRYGFQEDDRFLLDRLEVRCDTVLVGNVWFGYRTGALGKTLLCCIAEGRDERNSLARQEDPAGSGHYRNYGPFDRCSFKQSHIGLFIRQVTHFDYYDFEGPLYGNPVPVTEAGDNEDLYGVPGLLWRERGRIGGSLTGGWNVSGGVNIGFGYDTWLKTLTGGGHYSHSQDKTWGLVTLADIDGDGLPDKLFLDHDGDLRVRRHIPGQNAFGAPVGISSPGCFLRVENSSDNWGIEGNLAVISGGRIWSDSRSNTTAYLADIDGDGLADIVDGSRVYRNAGNLQFTDVTASDTLPGSGDCGGVTRFDGEVDTALFDDGDYTVTRVECATYWGKVTVCDTLRLADGRLDTIICHTEDVLVTEDCDTVVDTFSYEAPRSYEPDIDLVRMWVAPYGGAVYVDGVARLSDSLAAVRAATRGLDGVWVAVQRARDTVPLTVAVVTADSVRRVSCTANVLPGDTLYFRINTLASRRFDAVEWNPRVRYTRAVLRDGTVVTDSAALCATDFDGDSVYHFDYATDYLLSGSVPVSVGDSNGTPCWNRYAVRSRVRSAVPQSLPVRYRLNAVTLDDAGTRTPLASVLLPVDRAFDTVLTDTVTVPSGSGLLPCLDVGSGGPVRWGAVDASTEVTLVASGSQWLSGLLGDTATRGVFVYHPAVEVIHHDYLALPGEAVPSYTIPENRTVTFSAYTSANTPFSGTLPLIVRSGASHVTHNIQFQGGTASLTLQQEELSPSPRFDFHTGDAVLTAALIALRVHAGDSTYRAALYGVRSSDGGRHHGTLYRGWGQFGYKNESGINYIRAARTQAPVWYSASDSSDVPLPDSATLAAILADTLLAAGGQEIDTAGIYNPLADTFFELSADGSTGCWRGYGGVVTASRRLQNLDGADASQQYGGTGSTASVAEPDATQSPLPVIVPGVPLKAVGKLSVSSSRGSTVGIVSWSRGDSRLTSDYTDLNGDGYPDVVSEHSVQYSKAQGGLGTLENGYGERGMHAESTRSDGLVYPGTFVAVCHEAANNAKAGRAVTSVTGLAQLLSGENSTSRSTATRTLTDLNGDGLPDIVYSDGWVRYNMGYGFTQPRQSPLPAASPRVSSGEAWSAGVAFNIGATSIAGGMNINNGDNESARILTDVTGDGLPDLIMEDYVHVNRGDGTFSQGWYAGKDKGGGTSLTPSATVTLDAIIPLWIFSIKVGGSAGGGVTGSLNGTDGQFVDFDGDGFADYVSSESGSITVRLNRAAKAGLLRSVRLPSRATYTVDYTLSAATFDSPRRHWDMTSLKVYDGYGEDDGEDTLYRSFSYDGHRYDRYERDDLGVGNVRISEYLSRQDWLDGRPARSTMRRWHNGSWRLRGLPIEESVEDLQYGAVRSTGYTWRDADLRDGHWFSDGTAAWCRGDAWPALESVRTMTRETDGNKIKTRCDYAYGPYGNVVTVSDDGDTADSHDGSLVTLSYAADSAGRYLVSNVTEQTVEDGAGNILRRRTAAYNPDGALCRLDVQLDETGAVARWRVVYDLYGNTDTLFTPQTDSTGREPYWLHYTYDAATHRLPVRTDDADGYQSSAHYDLRWQKPTTVNDISGSKLGYEYDRFGRLATVTTMRDMDSGTAYSVRYDYWNSDTMGWNLYGYPADIHAMQPGNEHHYALWARTAGYDRQHPADDLETVLFCDGLGRTLQRKQDVETLQGGAGRRVSGVVVYDGLGRVTEERYPFFEPPSTQQLYLNPQAARWSVRREYDNLDRPLRTDYAYGAVEKYAYDTGSDSAAVIRQRVTATDRDGYDTKSLLDHRGQVIQTTDARGGKTYLCRDALGRVTAATDPEGYTSTHRYDIGGRRTERRHPATGVTRWRYDAAGNTVCQTSVGEGDSVEYGYHHGRLLWNRHSRSPWNDTRYLYGAPTQQDFSAGRVVMKRDASGVTRYGYDDLGNVTLERRTCVVPGSRDAVTLDTRWDYDSRGRVMRVLYPDSECVDYGYGKGGALQTVMGHKPGQQPATYIERIDYDLHGHRVYELDGDGVETECEYDSQNLRLERMKVRKPSNLLMSDFHYSYDLQGNIVLVVDSGANPRWQNFVYDSLHRLVQSEGAGSWGNVPLTYNTHFAYSPAGRLVEKDQCALRLDNMYGVYPVCGDYKYSYPAGSSDNPYAAMYADEIYQGDRVYFKWTESGAMKQADAHDMMRRQCWDEEVRMQSSFRGDGRGACVAWYGYDGGGERAMKLSGECVTLTQNGSPYTVASLTNPVVYASPLVTLTRRGYTKHYFEGERRICSAIGGGFTHVEWDSIDVSSGGGLWNTCDRLQQLLVGGVEEAMHCVEVNEMEIPDGVIHRMLRMEATKPHDDPEPVYYYHNDHLGGTAYLTDQTGQVAQTLAYLPYGEDWVDVTAFMYDTSQIGFYQFNGKEKDPETDYLYYGARYHWPDVWNGWLSPDPLMDEYPSISPYAYCNWNPVNLVDPDGMETVESDDHYLNLITGRVEHHDGSENRLKDGLVHLADDDASYGDIEQSLQNKGYDYQKSHTTPGGFRVNTEKQLKGWLLWKKMPVTAAFFGAELLGGVLESAFIKKKLPSHDGGGLFQQYNWAAKAADHMQNPSRSVPVSIIDEVIKNPKHITTDPQGSSAMMYYSTIFKNGKQYNIEVLYNRSNNTIFHFKYSNRELGPLPKIK